MASTSGKPVTMWLQILGYVVMLAALLVTHGRNLGELERNTKATDEMRLSLERVLISDGIQSTRIQRNEEEIRELRRRINEP